MMRRAERRGGEREGTQYEQIVLRRDGEGFSLEREITEKLSTFRSCSEKQNTCVSQNMCGCREFTASVPGTDHEERLLP